MSDVKKKSQRSDATLTPEWRTAYPFVHERRTKRADGAPIKHPTFDLTILAPKLHSDPSQCPNYRILAEHCYAAAKKMWPQSLDANGNWIWPNGAKWPIMDGDVPYKPKAPPPGQPAKAVDPNAHAWRKGNWQIEASHALDPGPRVCVMQNGQVTEIPAKIVLGQQMYKSGDYAYISLYAWAYEQETFGVNFGFDGVLFSKEGEQIGSSGGPRSAAQMFGSVAPVGQMMAPAHGAAGPAPTMPAPVAPPPAPAPVAPAAPMAAPVAPASAPQYAAAPPVAPVAPAAPQYAPPPAMPGAPAGLPPIPGR
jgi:hypothetical protein